MNFRHAYVTAVRSSVRQWIVGALIALVASAARAQAFDDVTMRQQGDDMVARISFNATVRFLQQTPATRAELYRITFDLVAADENVVNQSTEESKRVAASGAVPEFTLTYSPSRGRRVKELTLQLREAASIKVQQGPSSRTIDIVFVGLGSSAPLAQAVSPSVPPAAPSAPSPDAAASGPIETSPMDESAAVLLAKAKESLAAGKNEAAVDVLNRLLLLPPNKSSQEAQELIGLAWERAGNLRRARVEYELYLKLYPEGEGARRVSQRAASLEPNTPVESAKAATPDGSSQRTDQGSRFTGNIAQYYYGGKARSQSLVNIASGIDQSTLTTTTESAIVTSADLGARYSTADSETRVVVRGTNSTNLQSTSHSASLLNAAYVDYKRTESGLAVRVGRQSSISGGLLGLFDGASLTYPVSPGWKVDLMGGVPANQLVSAPAERLLAAVVEADGILDHWGGDVYLIDQTTEGIANRRALGAEVRFAGEQLSTYTLVDYDILFRAVNAVSLQGSYQAPGQTTITVLVDSRKAPSLQTTNALISSGATSLKTLLQVQTLQEVRDAARATTAEAKQALVSVSRPLDEKWQVAADLRYSAIGALPAVGNFDATPATGGQYGLTLQLTGSNLYSTRDINNLNASVLSTPFFKGVQVAYNNLTGLRDNDLTVEPSIRLYAQHDNLGVRLYRVTPGLRSSYRVSGRASVLGEGILEHSRTTGPTNHDTTNSIFFYVGYRYELF